MGRHANPDIRNAFAEFVDADTPSKCSKVRCLHCGYVRAKNTTRQIEHLQTCQIYLNSAEAQAHMQSTSDENSIPREASTAILNGTQPNPNLQVNRRGPNQKRHLLPHQFAPSPPQPTAPPVQLPSLTSHLLRACGNQFTSATQSPFLSHAGCGTLASVPLYQWMIQDAHYARGYIQFVGQLLAKVRLPVVQHSQFHPMYRTLDLLISALNNIRREMHFFEVTATKYNLSLQDAPPNPITRAYLDLFQSVTSSSATFLEGMVALWATEHCYRSAWAYASSFSSHALSASSQDTHIVALHQALIPNWTSAQFSKFVEACRSLVDELANTTEPRNGKEVMQRSEQVFGQICWLQERFWPNVDGMGEEDESVRVGGGRSSELPVGNTAGQTASNGTNGADANGSNDEVSGLLSGIEDASGSADNPQEV